MFPDLEFVKTTLNAITYKFKLVKSDIDAVKKSVDAVKKSVDAIKPDVDAIKPDVDAMRINRPNWAQNDPEALDYVKNRPFYIADEAYIGTLSFTATSSNTMDYTYTSVDKEIFSYFQALSEAGEVIKVNIGDLSGLMSSTFDRGYFGFLGILSGRMNYNLGQIWTATINDENITLVDGDTYNVVFYDTTTPGHIPIDAEFLPSSVHTDSNAPVKRGSGEYSVIEGYNTTASGDGSHAEGSGTTASGYYSHAEGSGTTASGYYSHAEGSGTTASGYYSHAEGRYTTVSGYYSHAEGYHTTASGDGSHAEGRYTTAQRRSQHVQGEYNVLDKVGSLSDRGKYAHIVGNGTSESARSNAHTLDWDGNAWYAGTIEGTALIIKSSTEGSTKRFKITVDDTGTLTATEVI